MGANYALVITKMKDLAAVFQSVPSLKVHCEFSQSITINNHLHTISNSICSLFHTILLLILSSKALSPSQVQETSRLLSHT